MRVASSISAFFVLFAGLTEAVNLRGNAMSCGSPSVVFQGSMSVSGSRPGSRVTYKCMKGTYMVGSSTATCTDHGVWSNAPPECRVEYLKKNDNKYKSGDKGYDLYSG